VASLIPRGVGVAAVVCRRRRWRRRVHGHGACSAGHHGQRAAAVLQHCELRILGHDLHHALFALCFLLALSCLHTLAAFALALLDLLDFTSVVVSASFFLSVIGLVVRALDAHTSVHSFLSIPRKLP